ncbi:hypothetical protein M569_08142, partial [Genlisea aurea]
ATFLCTRCQDNTEKDLASAVRREKDLDLICKDQAAEIENLKKMIEEFKRLSGAQSDSCRGSSNFVDVKNQQQLETISENEPDDGNQVMGIRNL